MLRFIKKVIITIIIIAITTTNILDINLAPYKIIHAEENQSIISIDGNTEDWNNIQPISVGGGSITSLSALQDKDNLYILVKGINLDVTSNFYINSDNDGSTGFQCWTWQNSGIEYMIENNSLYSYTGSGTDWSWAYTGVVTITKNDTVIEISVEQNQLGKTSPADMKISYCRNGVDYIPGIGMKMSAVVNSPTDASPVEYEKEESKSAGIVNQNGVFTLDTKYKQPNKFNIYYGELEYSGIPDYSDYDFLIVYDRNVQSVSKARSQGCNIFQYLYFGSRFENTDSFIEDFKNQVLELKNAGLADGVFLDECDVEYWELGYSSQADKCQIFHDRLKEVTDYCRSIGIQTVVNGTRAFCDLGDYYLWESFQGYWTTNTLTWSETAKLRQVSATGEVSYGMSLSDWTLNGSCYYDGQSIRGGSDGTAEILIDMDDILQEQDRNETYDWVFYEWFGEGANDNNCEIWVWTGDELPFSENTWDGTWRKLPKLWKGEPESWDGIGKSSRYLKIKMVFKGADSLKMDSILLTYNYKYPNWDMSTSNGQADTNPYMWNYNNSQRDFLWDEMDSSGNKVKVLTHSYGGSGDEYKKRYTYLSSAIWGFYSNDYVHPMMQNIYENNPADEPMGMLLYRTGDNIGYFTGGSATVDMSNHTYTLQRNEPSYWYDEAAVIDGDTSEWGTTDLLYEHTGQTFGAFSQWWGAYPSTYNNGTYDNVKAVYRNGYTILELINDGVGTWVSPVIKACSQDSKSLMKHIDWKGSVSWYYWKYKRLDGSWTDWEFVDRSSTPNVEFTEFQVKVKISGIASYTDTSKLVLDENGNLQPLEIFMQGDSFWGSSHTWDFVLPENINVQNFMMKDDNKYIYFSYKVEGQIDFSQNPNLPSNYNYNIYLDTLDDADKGYIGSWWKTSFGANYRISNSGVFKWDDSCTDRTDSYGWKWIGAAGMTYKLSADKKTIEYRINKESLGGLEAKDLNVYMQVEDPKTFIGNLIQPISDGATDFTGSFKYTQKSYKMKTPHGWYCSDEKEINVTDGYLCLAWNENKPEGTSVRAWVRTRQNDTNWNDWKEVHNGEPIYGTFNKAQYCFGLYTSNGEATPVVKNIMFDTIVPTDNLSILTGVNKLTHAYFPLIIMKDINPITVSITGPNDYSKTETVDSGDSYVYRMQYFTYPGEYTVKVNDSGVETTAIFSIELNKIDEAYYYFKALEHYGSIVTDIIYNREHNGTYNPAELESYEQTCLYIEVLLLRNSVIQNCPSVSSILITSVKNGLPITTSIIDLINQLKINDTSTNEIFSELQLKEQAVIDSCILNLLPTIGDIKGLWESLTGHDIITGDTLQWWEIVLGIICLSELKEINVFADLCRNADNSGDVLRFIKTASEALEKVALEGEKTSGGVLRKIGEMSADEYLRLEKIADNMYATFRSTSDDVAIIARNTGKSESDILKIKNHLFNDEHLFNSGVTAKFDPDYEQAMAWDRLMKGTGTETDNLLLNHELYELNYIKTHNCTYEVAHVEANKVYNWQSVVYPEP